MSEDAVGGRSGTCLQRLQTGFGLVIQRIWDSGGACMFLVSILFALAGFCIKLLNTDELRYSVFQIVAIRSGFSIIFTGMLIRRMQLDDEPDDPTTWFGSRQNYHKLAMRGVFGACAMCSYYFSIQLLTLGDAVTLFFTNAVVTAMASVLLGYEKPTWGMLIACCSCAGGVLLISRPSFLFGADDNASVTLWGVLIALFSSCFSAAAFLTMKSIGTDEKAVTTALWFHTVATSVCVVPILLSWPIPPVIPTHKEAWMLAFLAISAFLGHILLSRGLQLLNPSVAAAMNLMQVAHARALSILFLGDTLLWTGIVGSILVAGGVLSTQISKKSTSDGEEEAGKTEELATLMTKTFGVEGKSSSQECAVFVLSSSQTVVDSYDA